MVEYELVRSKRKTLAVQVTREGRVIVRAPLRWQKYRIERFVASIRTGSSAHLPISSPAVRHIQPDDY